MEKPIKKREGTYREKVWANMRNSPNLAPSINFVEHVLEDNASTTLSRTELQELLGIYFRRKLDKK